VADQRDIEPETEALTWDASAFIPPTTDLTDLRQAASQCRACDLYRLGTQTVFGQGPRLTEVLFVGEQPGDQEDRAGQPFVGPAGRVLDEALAEAGIDRSTVYVTNAVKHFKFEYRGKRRIHSKPNAREIRACKPWLSAELTAIQPRVLVCLGATAAQALLGTRFRVTQERGKPLRDTGVAELVVATIHPSSILRAPDESTRQNEMRAFIQDLRVVQSLLA
jgi:uracil-DNA glycosylase family protein